MNLFLVPASLENIEKTITRKVDFGTASKFLTIPQMNELRRVLGDKEEFNCWALTETKRAAFNSMKAGDVVLLAISGSGHFGYAGQVSHKIENVNLANHLWPYVPGPPWKLIYLLENITRIKVGKHALVKAIGYKPNFEVPGAIRVKDEYINNIISRYGSLFSFLESKGIETTWNEPELPAEEEIEHKISKGGGFGNPEKNRLVERAAVEHVTGWYKAAGWRVKSVEALRCGFDLICKKGAIEQHVEVKGVQGREPAFIITAGEVNQAKSDAGFIICIVTSALSDKREMFRYTGSELISKFELAPIAYRVSRRTSM